jgi:hypothetical protein
MVFVAFGDDGAASLVKRCAGLRFGFRGLRDA